AAGCTSGPPSGTVSSASSVVTSRSGRPSVTVAGRAGARGGGVIIATPSVPAAPTVIASSATIVHPNAIAEPRSNPSPTATTLPASNTRLIVLTSTVRLIRATPGHDRNLAAASAGDRSQVTSRYRPRRDL